MEWFAEDKLSKDITTEAISNEKLYAEWLYWCSLKEVPKIVLLLAEDKF